MNCLIIGVGPAGLAAAVALRHADPEARVTILSRETIRPYAKMGLPYLLADFSGTKNFFLPEPQGVSLLLNQEVATLDPGVRSVTTTSGEKFSYDRLLVATGGKPERPEIPGYDLPFVFTVRDYGDIEGIRKVYQGHRGHAVIAGAGPVGMETGDILHKLGMKITFVVTSDRVFSTILDVPASRLVERILTEKGVEVLKGENITAISPDGIVSLKSGAAQEANLVIFGKGVSPDVAFLAGSGIGSGRGITVNSHQETGVPGIYAAGDAAQTRDIVSGEMRVNALWPEAIGQGRIAGLNMAGHAVEYGGSLARNIMNVFGVSIFVAGAGRADGPEVLCEEGEGFYRKMVLDKGILKGAVFIGDVRNPGLYTRLMKEKVNVSGFATSLLRGTYSYPRLMRLLAKV